ncbi:hypothetical protein [Photobacterium damselae]|uniref:Uncharacterized protein n=1 Tax=Photobacterium damselae subsp. damselae TaxID=85581 RepID=A0A7Y7QAM3_PHODD|nr:hypothetical protein [Photobacterium damselae]AWK84616.1 hypothetical protein BST98_21555 [Photobacterium damselae]KAB1185689.1 hypothetical protein F6450_00940 [Photobacterium damselae subsp. damselae]MBE8127629.1 hypothetical protein [Photobacterium damselae subsp. piscicida]MCG3826516.1 hypothetical protein [Photobacterium damselae]NVO61494.1 hypothetical protein [Photobacterium damselae subsp. damselae]
MNNENNGDFFVMLTTQNGGCTPLMFCPDLTTSEPVFATFSTESEAKEAAEDSVLGAMFGYEVFERGYGC